MTARRFTHGTPEKRKFYSDLRKRDWANPEYAAMVKAKSAASLREQARRKRMSEIAKARWADPVWRAGWAKKQSKYMKSGAARKMLKAKAVKKAARENQPEAQP
jgi:hypothetical protein